MEYNYAEIEKKWQAEWKKNDAYKVEMDPARPKYYVLDMFPYPSGSGLHVGHPLGYIASDIFARYKKHCGYNVLHPMGFDAFGLPAEQYAIQTGRHPADTTAENIKRFKEQLGSMGFNYDWNREVQTCDPRYYKWTQWIFLQLFKSWYNKAADKAQLIDELMKIFEKEGNANVLAAGDQKEIFTAEEWKQKSEREQQQVLMNYRLAYLSFAEVNWCPELGTVLANDEVKDGRSERGGHPVVKKKMRQWFLRITAYAERLLNDLEALSWSDSMKEMQRNWIGRSEGASVNFRIQHSNREIEIYTTRPDTIFGATFMVLAPEHELVPDLTTPEQKDEIEKYLDYVQSRSERERQSEVKTVTGAFTGSYAINPFTDEKIPIWIAEYVLMGYGTGAIMAVPSDDDRDHAFATKFNLPIIDVIDKSKYPGSTRDDKEGIMINSGFVNGMEVPDAIKATIEKIEERGIGKRQVNYRLRDAIFGRQRYWGEPIPIYYKDDVPYPLDESELPLLLPEMEDFKPSPDGEPPLAKVEGWKYETTTMPGWAGSSWYFLRYMDPNNDEAFISKEAEQYWQDVDLYIGGTEHAVGHLLYARFWQKFLFDTGHVSKVEPFKKLLNQGMITGVSAKIWRLKKDATLYDSDEEKVFYTKFWNPVDLKIITIKGRHDVYYSSDIVFNANYDSPFHESKGDWINLNIDNVLPDMEENQLRFKIWFEKLKESNAPDSVFVNQQAYTSLELLRSSGYFINLAPNVKSTTVTVEDFYCKPEVEKMSKSKLNVVNPDDIISQYGADTFRMYEMFLGPIEQSKPWNTQGIDGVSKFVRKLWRLFYDEKGNFSIVDEPANEKELKVIHKTIKKVRDDIERFSFNTCVSAFMVCTNELTDLDCHKKEVFEKLVVLMAPFAPHLSEELWHLLGNKESVTKAAFPEFEEKYLTESTYTYPVSINGKMRAKIELPVDIESKMAEEEVLAMEVVQKWLEGKSPKKVVFVPGKIINLVV